MFLKAPELESVVLKRLEHLQGLENVPALGMLHCLTSVLQANNSAAGVEWSSTDGSGEGQQDHVQVDVSDQGLAAQLVAWQSWLAADGGVGKAQYFAATHALIQEVLNCTIVDGEPTISQVALDAAWQEDAGSSDSAALPADRFKSSLAALVTACSADGTPQGASACLGSVLPKLWDGKQPQQRWLDLSEQYSGAAAAVDAPAEGKADGRGAAEAGGSSAAAAGEESDDDLDALLGDDDGEAPAPAPAAVAASAAPDESSAAAQSSGGDAGAGGEGEAARAAPPEDDDAFSLGISRAPSTAASDGEEGEGEPSPPSAAPAAAMAAPAARAAAARGLSVKSIEDPELRRALSDASSADLDELPPEDLDSAVLRQGTHAKAPTRAARPTAGSDGSAKIGLSDLQTDLRSWAALKDKQREHAPNPGPPVPAKGRAPLAALGSPMAPPGRGDVGKSAADQHLKGVKNPLHGTVLSGSPVRQSIERDKGAAGSFISRHGSNASNESPGRLISNLSRKLSISEPGPVGQHAEWKHLPALGQASRLHPHEMRQPSYGVLRSGPSRGRTESMAAATALIDDKLPLLPSLAGARGQPPKAMELLRRPSVIQRSDGHHADSFPAAANPHLPGLGPNPKPQGARALCVQAKKSFRGDSNF